MLSWDLASSMQYTPGASIQGTFTLTVTEADAGKPVYILGCLYDLSSGVPIAGTEFVLYWDDSLTQMLSQAGLTPVVKDLPAAGSYELPFSLAFNRTDVRLHVWMLERVGDEPDPDTDTILDILTTDLRAAPSVIEQMMPLIGLVMVLGLVGGLMRAVTE